LDGARWSYRTAEGCHVSWYGDPVDKVVGAAVLNAGTLRFDGSDSMPSALVRFLLERDDSWASGSESMTQALATSTHLAVNTIIAI